MLVARLWHCVSPWTVARQVALSTGFSRREHSSGLPLPPPGGLPHPGIEPVSPALQVYSLLSEPPGKPEKRWTLLRKSWDEEVQQTRGPLTVSLAGLRSQEPGVSPACWAGQALQGALLPTHGWAKKLSSVFCNFPFCGQPHLSTNTYFQVGAIDRRSLFRRTVSHLKQRFCVS